MTTGSAFVRPAPVWQYMVQRATTREILTRQADIATTDETYALSASGSASFVTKPAVAEKVAADGQPMFGKLRTIIVAIANGEPRWRGIVTAVTTEGPTRTITVHSVSAYPSEKPWLGAPYYGAEVDPADIVRMVWEHVQSYRVPQSDLGVTVTGSTPIRIGTYSTQNKADTLDAYNAAVRDYDAALAARRAAQADETAARSVYSDRVADVTAASRALSSAKSIRPRDDSAIAAAQSQYDAAVAARVAQQSVVDGLTAETDRRAAIVNAREADKSSTYAAKVAASKAAKDDGGAFTLLPWELPDCGQTIQQVTADNGIDWFERHAWNEDRTDVVTEIVLAYPRAGSRRRDLVFEQGTNITIVPSVEDSDEEYANTHVLVGAGEGVGAIRRESSVEDGALRSVTTISAKDVKSVQQADLRIKAAQQTSLATEEISTINVVDSVLAPLGSWGLGDDIRIDFVSDATGETRRLWHRVVSWTRTSDRTATLSLRRSNAYTYGG